jgi:NAD(P)-dependent dehydrogenase (short-subunit alcohol dehydrogenase family)
MSQLKSQSIVILGAGGGFGRALVAKISQHGPRLALGNLTKNAGTALAEEARAAGATDVLTGPVDVTDELSVERFFARVARHYGHADVLVYLPGLSIASPVAAMKVEDYDQIIDVNLKGLFLAAKHWVPLAKPERNPLLAFISSQASTRANPNAPVYCAAKAAVSMFGQGLALQLMGNNVRVTSIKPGPVDTRGFWGDRPVPREKFMQPADVACVIEFVLNLPTHIVMHEVSFESFEFFKK